MLSKINIFFLTIIIFFFTNQVNSKTSDYNFKKKDFANYLSAIISYNNLENDKSLNYFNSSKSLIKKYDNYFQKYIFSLVANQKVKRAIQEIKFNNFKNNFFESNLILILDLIKKSKFEESEKYLNRLSDLNSLTTYENAIYNTLKTYISTFKNKKLESQKSNFDNLDLLNNTFLKCYLDDKTTAQSFNNLVNSAEVDYSRYLFFYVNYLISNNKIDTAKEQFINHDPLDTELLLLQTRDWLFSNQIKKITEIFSCKSETDLLAEFFFLISNLYSSEENIEMSNFYLNISNFLNNKFKPNKLLLAENYYNSNKLNEVKKIIKIFSDEDKIFYWYRVKLNTKIIESTQDEKKSLNYIESKFKEITLKTEKITFDMANIYKSYKKYPEAIILYNKLMKNFDQNSDTYADLLFRRGGSKERMGDYKDSDKDLLQALKIVPDDSYVLNYLAYSWLEREINISKAVAMLEIAYKNNKDDPYITDSIGWGYYLIGKYEEAERLMRKAIILMPNDPIVNDHYGDILWKLNKKIQAKYYWKSVLNFKDTEIKMREKIKIKLLTGPKIENNNS